MTVEIKQGREKTILSRHPWIFSGAIQRLPEFIDGDVLQVMSANGKMLGHGYFNRKSQITGRMISYGNECWKSILEQNLLQAIKIRKSLIGDITNAVRLINAEGDNLPGLIVDQFDSVLCIQVSTLGMERLKEQVVSILQKALDPSWIVEVSTSPSRKEEGLKECRQTLYGTEVSSIQIVEDGLKFLVSPLTGQKTGFFQDLREMRLLVQQLARGRRVLNCFSYTGAFSCHALKGGASFCASVDISKDAIQKVTEHMKINGFADDLHAEYAECAFDFLRREQLDYDLIILDPPAFAKRKSDIPNATRGYQEINRTTLAKMPKGSLLLTCSCSYHVDETLFRKILFHAAREAGRDIRILQSHRLAFDHLVSIYHPEGSYLKSFFCYVI